MYNHSAAIQDDGSEEIIFKWHWPRGSFDKRMSAYELAAFILPHMPSILPLLSDHPRVQIEFNAMMNKLLFSPKAVIDEVLPWIKSVIRTEEDDIIELNIKAKAIEAAPVHFLIRK